MGSGGVLLGNLGGVVLACSRLSDSGEDAKVKGTRKVRWRGEKGEAPSLPSFLPFYFRLRAFSIQRAQLSRTLEKVTLDSTNWFRSFTLKMNPDMCYLSESYQSHDLSSKTLQQSPGIFFQRSPGRINIHLSGSCLRAK